MFEYDEETNTWAAAHHPFTQFDHSLDEVQKLDKSKIKAKSYDLVMNGFELYFRFCKNFWCKNTRICFWSNWIR
ncbi:hypothetical protein [Mycoplasmopsis cynos]|uniref:hypothetical protein n=1 Tax=Mycoplasmopsis cynos TaxID=171284 RepID=UPI003A5C81A0